MFGGCGMPGTKRGDWEWFESQLLGLACHTTLPKFGVGRLLQSKGGICLRLLKAVLLEGRCDGNSFQVSQFIFKYFGLQP
jgi:hypothetical protein